MEEGGFVREAVGLEESAGPSSRRPNSAAEVDIVPNFARRVLSHDGLGSSYSGCTKCSNLSFSQEFANAFGVYLCITCRRKEKLISKVRFEF